jgi:hypothetical protein
MTDLIPIETITGLIYLIRGQRVMLDQDLASLYDVETKVLKQAVRRNIERFPADFMFELSKAEFAHLRSQFVTSSWGGIRYAPMAFTEHGVLMLSSVLKNERAIQVNIQIMRTFLKFRNMLSTNEEFKRKIEDIEKRYDERFEIIFHTLDQLLTVENKPKKKIGFTARERQ